MLRIRAPKGKKLYTRRPLLLANFGVLGEIEEDWTGYWRLCLFYSNTSGYSWGKGQRKVYTREHRRHSCSFGIRSRVVELDLEL